MNEKELNKIVRMLEDIGFGAFVVSSVIEDKPINREAEISVDWDMELKILMQDNKK